MKKKKWLLPIAVTVALPLFIVAACSTKLKTVVYQVESPFPAEPVKLALVTDLHACPYGENQADLVAAVDAQMPDAILLGGDIFDDDTPPENAYTFVSCVVQKYPCYYVAGNHEAWSGDAAAYKEWLRRQGVAVLEGTCAVLTVRGTSLNLCGVDDPALVGEAVFAEQLQSASRARRDGLFSVLLSHKPEWVQTYLQYDFDLILAGHAHGGQWRLPGLCNGVYAPGQGMFPKYAGGEYTFGDTTMLVSRGLSHHNDPVPRIFNRPELVIIEID